MEQELVNFALQHGKRGLSMNSQRATQFRICAKSALKKYIIDGYVINQEKLQQQKLDELDQTIKLIMNMLYEGDF